MALKGNHKNLNEEISFIFDTSKTIASDHFEETEKSHGRVNTRVFDLIKVNKTNLPKINDWKGLQAVGRVQTSVLHNGKETFETRFYLLSYSDVKLFAKSPRGHWGVESLHWVLDVTYNKDASRKRKDHAPRNYSPNFNKTAVFPN